MRSQRTFVKSAASILGIFITGLILCPSAQAQGGKIISRSDFRRTVDPSPRGPTGSLLLTEQNGKQIFRVQLDDLPITDLSIQLSFTSSYDGTNFPVFYVAPLNRTGKQEGTWSNKLTGNGGAPPELQYYGIPDLSSMGNLNSFVVGTPGETNILGGTNFIQCTQIFTNNMTITTCETNIIGGTTNIYVDTYVWAPVPPLVPNGSIFNMNKKVDLIQPAIPPSPNAKGTIKLTYNGSQGHSLIDVTGHSMTKGQTYALWVTDAGTNVNSGNFDFVGADNGPEIRFRRETKKGDPLPVQVPDSTSLTGRVFSVRDGFGVIHLEGIVP